jgi:hypothetical protein
MGYFWETHSIWISSQVREKQYQSCSYCIIKRPSSHQILRTMLTTPMKDGGYWWEDFYPSHFCAMPSLINILVKHLFHLGEGV